MDHMRPPSVINPAATGPAETDPAEAPEPVSFGCRLRVLTLAVVGPLVTGYAAVAALLALVAAAAPQAHFSTLGVLRAAAPGWLAAHQVPVNIQGLELGALPLVPTILLLVAVGRAAAGAAQRLGLTEPWQATQVVVTIAVGHGVLGVGAALSSSDGAASADPLTALCYPALLSALAATAGLARGCGLIDAALAYTDDVAARGIATGLFAVAALLTAGAGLLLLGLVTSLGTTRELFGLYAPGLGNGLGMLLLSAGYLPNGVLAATAFFAGPGFELGGVAVAPLEFSGGPVPGLPLLAALPETQAAWWPLLFALPLGVGVLVGRKLRDVAEAPAARLRAVAVAAGTVGLVFVLLAGSAGGRVGSGLWDPLDLRAALLSVTLVGWVFVPGALVAWLTGPRPEPEGPAGLISPEDTEEAEPDADRGDGADNSTKDSIEDTAESPVDESPEPEPDLVTGDTDPPPTLNP